MAKSKPLDLANARILVSNDDGIAAPGIKILVKIARSISNDVWVVAPETEQSAVSHSLTIRRPLRVRKLGPKRFAVDGTPTDAVLLAINHIMKKKKPTLCLSGVNRGGNMGEDVLYSGTVAAAMEATMLGVKSIALSQYTRAPAPPKWSTAEHFAAGIIRELAKTGWPDNVLVNVNFPDAIVESVKGVVVAKQGRHKIGDQLVENHDPRGVPYYWIGAMRLEDATRKGTDIAAVLDNYIAVTPLNLDLTDRRLLSKLAAVIK
jgi:5'-nucleotidase